MFVVILTYQKPLSEVGEHIEFDPFKCHADFKGFFS
jgi:hypothetical protein